MWQDIKDYILFLLAVLSGLGIKDFVLNYWRNHTAIRLECDIVPCLDQVVDDKLTTLFIIPEGGWPNDENVVSKIRVKAVNNGGGRILIVNGTIVVNGNEMLLQYHNSYRTDLQIHLDPLELPKIWTAAVQLDKICKLDRVYLVDSTGKKRQVSRKRVKELRFKAKSILAELACDNTSKNWLSSGNLIAHQIELDDTTHQQKSTGL